MTGKELSQRHGEHRAGIILCAILLLAGSCGIEMYYSLEPPLVRNLANSTDTGGRYFSFRTNANSSRFKGTNIFYKIYNTLSDLQSDLGSIDAANSEYSANGYNRMAALGYQQLNVEENFLISGSVDVFVRLFDEGWNSNTTPPKYDFPAGIFENNMSSPPRMRPLRRSNGKGFNFYVDPDPIPISNSSDYDDLPVSTDLDTRFSSSPEADTWYINAYAVSVGQDDYLTPLYSQLLWLGYIQIKKP